ncbi:MAG: hypothetical protein GY940_35690, partial [bacterium]|nr:hypothetical protein [bacterium]
MKRFETAIHTRLSEALFLADLTRMHINYTKEGIRLLDRLEKEFALFAGNIKDYDHIRLLDLAGRETLRINNTTGGIKVVPKHELQDKSKRPYFKKSLKCRQRIYISHFDLNVEKGEIQKPYKPVLRLGVKVLGDKGKLLGVLVLNLQGKNLLKYFKPGESGTRAQHFLLNSEG